MSENPEALDWARARGEKWNAQLQSMEGTLQPVDPPLVEALALFAPMRIAEIGSGGGGTALEILRRAPAGSVVHGYDISPRLVETARGRVRDPRVLRFEVADMGKAVPEQPYDRLVSRFGIMFFDDPPAAFTNLLRWLLPGGRFAFAAWALPVDNPWFVSVREVVAQIVEVPKPDPDAPGPFRYSEAIKLLELLEQAGFAELQVHEFRGKLPLGGGLAPAEAARFALTAMGAFDELLTQAGEDARAEAHRRLSALYEQRYLERGVVRMDARVHLFTGARTT